MATNPVAVSSAEVKDFLLSQGVDCLGIAPVAQIPPSFPPRRPEEMLPGAKSVVVFGLRMMDGSIESPSHNAACTHTNGMYAELARISYQAGRFLERKGYRSAPVPTHIPVTMSKETKGMVADLSLKHVAIGAGLGVMGRNRLVITPQWGPRVRFGAVVTDAALEGDPLCQEPLCTNCDLCLEACPAKAIAAEGEEGKVDIVKCLVRLQPYGLANMIRFLSEVVIKNPEEQQKAFRDPYFWNLYQAPSMGLYYECYECLKSCPVGR